jgi:hypothetical protein
MSILELRFGGAENQVFEWTRSTITFRQLEHRRDPIIQNKSTDYFSKVGLKHGF